MTTLGITVTAFSRTSSPIVTSSPKMLSPSKRVHFPILHFHPMIEPDIAEFLLTCVSAMITVSLSLHPEAIVTPGPTITFGPIIESSSIVAVGS
jgi:hypothetical protein